MASLIVCKFKVITQYHSTSRLGYAIADPEWGVLSTAGIDTSLF